MNPEFHHPVLLLSKAITSLSNNRPREIDETTHSLRDTTLAEPMRVTISVRGPEEVRRPTRPRD